MRYIYEKWKKKKSVLSAFNCPRPLINKLQDGKKRVFASFGVDCFFISLLMMLCENTESNSSLKCKILFIKISFFPGSFH